MKRHPILPPQTYITRGDDATEAAGPRVTPLPLPPEWLREFASGNYAALARQQQSDAEAQFWSGSPRYSASVKPLVKPAPRSGNRVILAACLWLVFAVLGVEAMRVLMEGAGTFT